MHLEDGKFYLFLSLGMRQEQERAIRLEAKTRSRKLRRVHHRDGM